MVIAGAVRSAIMRGAGAGGDSAAASSREMRNLTEKIKKMMGAGDYSFFQDKDLMEKFGGKDKFLKKFDFGTNKSFDITKSNGKEYDKKEGIIKEDTPKDTPKDTSKGKRSFKSQDGSYDVSKADYYRDPPTYTEKPGPGGMELRSDVSEKDLGQYRKDLAKGKDIKTLKNDTEEVKKDEYKDKDKDELKKDGKKVEKNRLEKIWDTLEKIQDFTDLLNQQAKNANPDEALMQLLEKYMPIKVPDKEDQQQQDGTSLKDMRGEAKKLKEIQGKFKGKGKVSALKSGAQESKHAGDRKNSPGLLKSEAKKTTATDVHSDKKIVEEKKENNLQREDSAVDLKDKEIEERDLDVGENENPDKVEFSIPKDSSLKVIGDVAEVMELGGGEGSELVKGVKTAARFRESFGKKSEVSSTETRGMDDNERIHRAVTKPGKLSGSGPNVSGKTPGGQLKNTQTVYDASRGESVPKNPYTKPLDVQRANVDPTYRKGPKIDNEVKLEENVHEGVSEAVEDINDVSKREDKGSDESGQEMKNKEIMSEGDSGKKWEKNVRKVIDSGKKDIEDLINNKDKYSNEEYKKKVGKLMEDEHAKVGKLIEDGKNQWKIKEEPEIGKAEKESGLRVEEAEKASKQWDAQKEPEKGKAEKKELMVNEAEKMKNPGDTRKRSEVVEEVEEAKGEYTDKEFKGKIDELKELIKDKKELLKNEYDKVKEFKERGNELLKREYENMDEYQKETGKFLEDTRENVKEFQEEKKEFQKEKDKLQKEKKEFQKEKKELQKEKDKLQKDAHENNADNKLSKDTHEDMDKKLEDMDKKLEDMNKVLKDMNKVIKDFMKEEKKFIKENFKEEKGKWRKLYDFLNDYVDPINQQFQQMADPGDALMQLLEKYIAVKIPGGEGDQQQQGNNNDITKDLTKSLFKKSDNKVGAKAGVKAAGAKAVGGSHSGGMDHKDGPDLAKSEAKPGLSTHNIEQTGLLEHNAGVHPVEGARGVEPEKGKAEKKAEPGIVGAVEEELSTMEAEEAIKPEDVKNVQNGKNSENGGNYSYITSDGYTMQSARTEDERNTVHRITNPDGKVAYTAEISKDGTEHEVRIEEENAVYTAKVSDTEHEVRIEEENAVYTAKVSDTEHEVRIEEENAVYTAKVSDTEHEVRIEEENAIYTKVSKDGTIHRIQIEKGDTIYTAETSEDGTIYRIQTPEEDIVKKGDNVYVNGNKIEDIDKENGIKRKINNFNVENEKYDEKIEKYDEKVKEYEKKAEKFEDKFRRLDKLFANTSQNIPVDNNIEETLEFIEMLMGDEEVEGTTVSEEQVAQVEGDKRTKEEVEAVIKLEETEAKVEKREAAEKSKLAGEQPVNEVEVEADKVMQEPGVYLEKEEELLSGRNGRGEQEDSPHEVALTDELHKDASQTLSEMSMTLEQSSSLGQKSFIGEPGRNGADLEAKTTVKEVEGEVQRQQNNKVNTANGERLERQTLSDTSKLGNQPLGKGKADFGDAKQEESERNEQQENDVELRTADEVAEGLNPQNDEPQANQSADNDNKLSSDQNSTHLEDALKPNVDAKGRDTLKPQHELQPAGIEEHQGRVLSRGTRKFENGQTHEEHVEPQSTYSSEAENDQFIGDHDEALRQPKEWNQQTSDTVLEPDRATIDSVDSKKYEIYEKNNSTDLSERDRKIDGSDHDALPNMDSAKEVSEGSNKVESLERNDPQNIDRNELMIKETEREAEDLSQRSISDEQLEKEYVGLIESMAETERQGAIARETARKAYQEFISRGGDPEKLVDALKTDSNSSEITSWLREEEFKGEFRDFIGNMRINEGDKALYEKNSKGIYESLKGIGANKEDIQTLMSKMEKDDGVKAWLYEHKDNIKDADIREAIGTWLAGPSRRGTSEVGGMPEQYVEA